MLKSLHRKKLDSFFLSETGFEPQTYKMMTFCRLPPYLTWLRQLLNKSNAQLNHIQKLKMTENENANGKKWQ